MNGRLLRNRIVHITFNTVWSIVAISLVAWAVHLLLHSQKVSVSDIILKTKSNYGIKEYETEYVNLTEPDIDPEIYNRIVRNGPRYQNVSDPYGFDFGRIESVPLKRKDVNCIFGNGSVTVNINNKYKLQLSKNKRLFDDKFRSTLLYSETNLDTKHEKEIRYEPDYLENFYEGFVMDEQMPNWVNVYVSKDCDIMGSIHLKEEEFHITPSYYYSRVYRNDTSDDLAITKSTSMQISQSNLNDFDFGMTEDATGDAESRQRFDKEAPGKFSSNTPICKIQVKLHHSMLYGPLGSRGDPIFHAFRYAALLVADASRIIRASDAHKNDRLARNITLSINRMYISLNPSSTNINSKYYIRSKKVNPIRMGDKNRFPYKKVEVELVDENLATETEYEMTIKEYLENFKKNVEDPEGKLGRYFRDYIVTDSEPTMENLPHPLDREKFSVDGETPIYMRHCLRIVFTGDNFLHSTSDQQTIAYNTHTTACNEMQNIILAKISATKIPPPEPVVQPMLAMGRLERYDVTYSLLANRITSVLGADGNRLCFAD
ncbi:hypothetical protein QYM36_004685 [Artemia franciscana]|uniref:Uncharacterized protein n=1 Tax=Artemia franciscana TaxID=6661 RepID=A0AA88LD68_ARTSF|nr:hypothetical protein QYM36_004685 [Artemia franciscana]